MHSDSTRSHVVLALPAIYALIQLAATAGAGLVEQVTVEATSLSSAIREQQQILGGYYPPINLSRVLAAAW
jgi:hypothetical protein